MFTYPVLAVLSDKALLPSLELLARLFGAPAVRISVDAVAPSLPVEAVRDFVPERGAEHAEVVGERITVVKSGKMQKINQ